MSCFCRQSVAMLHTLVDRAAVPGDSAPAAPDDAPDDAAEVAQAARALAAAGVPAPPWRPDPSWRDRPPPPAPRMSPGSIATLTALAQLRQQAQAAGIDLLDPEQAPRLSRLIATMNARLAALGAKAQALDPLPWQRLAGQNAAADRVRDAMRAGALQPQDEAAAEAGGQWTDLVRRVQAMAPLLAVASQMDAAHADPDEAAGRLAAATRALRTMAPPPLADPALAQRLLATAAAVASLKQSLGRDPLEQGYAATRAQVERKTQAARTVLQRTPVPATLKPNPSAAAPAAVVDAAGTPAAHRLAGLAWRVPPAHDLPAVSNGLPATALVQSLAQATGTEPARRAPCDQGCDAARLGRGG